MNERQITPVTHQSNVPAGINFFDPTTIETLNRFIQTFFQKLFVVFLEVDNRLVSDYIQIGC